jgi:hypothetical protein
MSARRDAHGKGGSGCLSEPANHVAELHDGTGVCYAGAGASPLEHSSLYAYKPPQRGTLQAVGPVADFSTTGSVLQGPAPEEPGQPMQAILARVGCPAEERAP